VLPSGLVVVSQLGRAEACQLGRVADSRLGQEADCLSDRVAASR